MANNNQELTQEERLDRIEEKMDYIISKVEIIRNMIRNTYRYGL